jgi:hypothetical protein
MKSAYELAMERLARQEPTRVLTDAQKKELADLDSVYRAKLAERETFLHSKIEAARLSGDVQTLADLEKQRVMDIQTIREEWDMKKEKLRKKFTPS